MPPGRLIAFEGGEGAGKSTQAERLAHYLRSTGREAVLTREPGGTEGAEAIRDLLLHRTPAGGWTAEAEALLFAAARADHVTRLIRPALQRGAWVVCDRFIGSTFAYQGAAGGLSAAAVQLLHDVGSGGLMPDATFVLTLSQEEAASRANARGGPVDAIGGRDEFYHQAVGRDFARQAEEDAAVHAINGSGLPDAVAGRIVAALTELRL